MNELGTFFDGGWLAAQLLYAQRWLGHNVLNWSVAWQVAATALALLAARLAAPHAARGLNTLAAAWPPLAGGRAKMVLAILKLLAVPVLWLLLQWLATLALAEAHRPNRLCQTVAALLSAWVVIRLSTMLVADRGWSRLIAFTAWAVAALEILGWLHATVRALDAIGLDFGETRLSLLLVIKAFAALALLLWLAGALSRTLEKRILALPNLTPSAQVLFAKVTKVTLVTLGVVVALHGVGIDLSAFALLSGAIGLGVGFGLQKVVSNLISGLILLLDKSIKPGDVIGIGDTYGWIASLGARYVSVVTRDGVEHLIPNEELITQRVQNWSFSNERVRIKIPVGISYQSDLPRAMALCVEAARAVPRVLKDPEPACLFVGFGDSALNLELRVWIDDPKNGINNCKSAVLLGIWERFRAAGIDLPYPQRDIHIRTVAVPEGRERLPVA